MCCAQCLLPSHCASHNSVQRAHEKSFQRYWDGRREGGGGGAIACEQIQNGSRQMATAEQPPKSLASKNACSHTQEECVEQKERNGGMEVSFVHPCASAASVCVRAAIRPQCTETVWEFLFICVSCKWIWKCACCCCGVFVVVVVVFRFSSNSSAILCILTSSMRDRFVLRMCACVSALFCILFWQLHSSLSPSLSHLYLRFFLQRNALHIRKT